ncbi:MAG: ParB-like nuclease [uncultured Rubrobacteraceae bacterium]|uniref:ParB-like nuclease n=1 Tax=uncultured Rubrobacteraceae bacterium TaxID=349277 RepID=A0A6J4QQF0_9ACTN|nr:MAG: ParB-like nuclease [uncultured Rubrobacteraceae bacterium]
MISSLKDLRLVEPGCLLLHEAHDEARLARLKGRILAEDEQRNPVVASSYGDRFLVLDGAHRVRAMDEIGARFVLVQVVEPPERAEGWGHLVGGMGPLYPDDANGLVVGGESGEAVAEIETSGGETVSVRSREAGSLARSRAMWALQARYPGEAAVRRVEPDGAVRLSGGEVLIRYRPFAPEDLVEIVGSGAVLPAGVTRFRVRERVLGVRYPLSKMMDGEPRHRNVELRRFVSKRWAENRVRYYREPVVLFE